MKTYRNATVAHSQSELAVTYALGVLDSETLRVRDVTGLTVVVPLPDRIVRQFRALIDAMERRLDEVLEPVRVGLMKTLAEVDGSQLQARAVPEIQERWAHQFDAKSKRALYPSGHTVYWDVITDAANQ
jgi:hypothetical protein